jgi:hypothetical protein
MPTVIDALVVTLGLDPSKFTAGQRKALTEFKRTQEEAASHAKRFEESARRSAMLFSKIRNEAVGLFAALAGAYGVKQFIANLVGGDAAMGRFSRTTGIAVKEAAAFDAAVKAAGGEAGEGAAALSNLNSQIQQFQLGLNPQIIATYNALAAQGGVVIDVNASIVEQYKAIAENLKNIKERFGAGRAGELGRQLGINEATINLLIQGRHRVDELVVAAQKFGTATKENTDAAEKFWNAWQDAGTKLTSILRPLVKITSDMLDGINKVLDKAQQNQAGVTDKSGNIIPGSGAKRLGGWMKYLFGLEPEAGGAQAFGPNHPGRAGGAGPVLPPAAGGGGMFGGMGFQPMDWSSFGARPVGGSTSSSSTTINVGEVNVVTQATDAGGIGTRLHSELERVAASRRNAALANSN